jgi:hypothetical protein
LVLYERYSHGVRRKSKKKIVQGPEIEDLGDYLTGDLLAPHLERLFGSFMKDLSEMLAKSEPSMFLGTIGGCSLTTLGITSNYFAMPHLDLEDLGFAFLTWFVKGKIFIKFFLFVLIIFPLKYEFFLKMDCD